MPIEHRIHPASAELVSAQQDDTTVIAADGLDHLGERHAFGDRQAAAPSADRLARDAPQWAGAPRRIDGEGAARRQGDGAARGSDLDILLRDGDANLAIAIHCDVKARCPGGAGDAPGLDPEGAMLRVGRDLEHRLATAEHDLALLASEAD